MTTPRSNGACSAVASRRPFEGLPRSMSCPRRCCTSIAARSLNGLRSAARLPAIYQWPETADDGGLLGYGPSFIDVFRQRARMVVKVLRGVKPADLPIEQPTTFKLAINLKTAKAMNHTVPVGLLLRADKLIE